MAGTKITALNTLATPALTDVLVVVDVSEGTEGVTKKIAYGDFVTALNTDIDSVGNADNALVAQEALTVEITDVSARTTTSSGLVMTDATGNNSALLGTLLEVYYDHTTDTLHAPNIASENISSDSDLWYSYTDGTRTVVRSDLDVYFRGVNTNGTSAYIQGGPADELDVTATGGNAFEGLTAIQPWTSVLSYGPDGTEYTSALLGLDQTGMHTRYGYSKIASTGATYDHNVKHDFKINNVTVLDVDSVSTTMTGNVKLPSLPTSDPSGTGLLWNDGGTLVFSGSTAGGGGGGGGGLSGYDVSQYEVLTTPEDILQYSSIDAQTSQLLYSLNPNVSPAETADQPNNAQVTYTLSANQQFGFRTVGGFRTQLFNIAAGTTASTGLQLAGPTSNNSGVEIIGNVKLSSLPSSDPSEAGLLWNDGGTPVFSGSTSGGGPDFSPAISVTNSANGRGLRIESISSATSLYLTDSDINDAIIMEASRFDGITFNHPVIGNTNSSQNVMFTTTTNGMFLYLTPRLQNSIPTLSDEIASKFYVDSQVGNKLSGTGSPEGAVSAPVGTLYTDDNGGPGTTLYVKESGTGGTGWAAK